MDIYDESFLPECIVNKCMKWYILLKTIKFYQFPHFVGMVIVSRLASQASRLRGAGMGPGLA